MSIDDHHIPLPVTAPPGDVLASTLLDRHGKEHSISDPVCVACAALDAEARGAGGKP